MGNAAYIYKKIYNEGTFFPPGLRQVTYLYRTPSYSIPPVTSSSYRGNSSLYDTSQFMPSILIGIDNLQRTQCHISSAPWVDGPFRVFAGLNTVNFYNYAKANQWAFIRLHYGYWTRNISVTDLKLTFSNGVKYFIKDAIDNGYLSPLCLIYGSNYWMDLYSSGDTPALNYPIHDIVCKPLLYDIVGIEFTSNKDADWGGHGPNEYYDGVYAYTYDKSVQFSLTPILTAKRIKNIRRKDTDFERIKNGRYFDGTNFNRINL